MAPSLASNPLELLANPDAIGWFEKTHRFVSKMTRGPNAEKFGRAILWGFSPGAVSTTTVNISVNCSSLTITPSVLPDGATGTAYSQNFAAAGGASPYSFTVTSGALPSGLTLATNGLLSGTPTTGGTFDFTVTATYGNGCPGSKDFTVNVDAAPTPTPLQLPLDESGPTSTQVAALDSVLFLRDPFPVVNGANLLNLGVDRNTRVIVFVINLQLAQGEISSSVVVNLTDSNNQSYDVAAEEVRLVPNFNFTQVTFRLPDNLPAGTCSIIIKAHGQVSNLGTIRIRI